MTCKSYSDGKRVSLLGYGAMRLPTVDGAHANGWAPGVSAAEIDQALLNRQVRRMLDLGITYFDTSPAYCRGESERRLGEALAKSGYDREAYVIATKLSNFAPAQYPLERAQAMFAESLRYLRTDYVDNYLLHAIGNGGFETFSKRYLENGALDWCLKLRDERKVRNLGFSYHGDRRAWDWCIERHGRYHWDFVQIQMNYADWRHAKTLNDRNLNAEYLYRTLTELKIPVVVMEPLLGGRLARYNYALARELAPLDPNASLAKWALRFCGSFDNVMTVLSGMTYTEHIEENAAAFSPLKPCTEREFAALERAAEAMIAQHTVPCTACNYCMPCPYGLDIPSIFAFRNRVLTAKTPPSAAETLRLYAEAVPERLRRAERCTGCDRCRSHCPQSIDIPGEMAAIGRWIDELRNEVAR